MPQTTTEYPTVYSDLGGMLACPKHMGSAAEAKMAGKTPRKVTTYITVWEKYSPADHEYWKQEFGTYAQCETCRYGR